MRFRAFGGYGNEAREIEFEADSYGKAFVFAIASVFTKRPTTADLQDVIEGMKERGFYPPTVENFADIVQDFIPDDSTLQYLIDKTKDEVLFYADDAAEPITDEDLAVEEDV